MTDQPGIRTWHAFSAGSHYDADNVSFGPVIGCDEHLVEPGAGFDRHAHRGVVIVSWVLAGSLRHQDDSGSDLRIVAGGLLVQSAGDGVTHHETNASGTEALRFVQITLLLDLERSVRQPVQPARIGEFELDVVAAPTMLGAGFMVVGAAGSTLGGVALDVGDSLRLEHSAEVAGTATVLTLTAR